MKVIDGALISYIERARELLEYVYYCSPYKSRGLRGRLRAVMRRLDRIIDLLEEGKL